MVKNIKQFFYDLLFDFEFFQRLVFINEKVLFFNLTFFFRKKQLFKRKTKSTKAKLSIINLIILKFKKIQPYTLNLTLFLNLIFKSFVTILKNLTFSLILTYYFFTFLLNLVLFLFKFIYRLILQLKLLFYKVTYRFLDFFGFQTFLFFYNLFYFFVTTFLILAIFVLCFYFFKINYFNTDYFYVNFFPYENSVDQSYLSTKQLYYYRFSLWWIFRIYLFYLLIYIFVKDLRQLIRENLMLIIFLPIVICNFNFKFFILLVFGTIVDAFGSLKLNKDIFFLIRAPYKSLYSKRPFSFRFLNYKFNFLFSNSLVEESRRIRLLQSSTNNSLDQLSSSLNLRDESTSYKAEILRIKKLKAIQDYYLDFKIVSKKNKVLETLQHDTTIDDLITDTDNTDFYHKFFYYSNFYTIGKNNDPLNLLKKNTNNLVKMSPYLDINLINNDNYKTFKTNNYYKNNDLYRKKIALIDTQNPISEPDLPTYLNRVYNINYNKISYVYDLFNEINNKKLKQRANKLIIESRFNELVEHQYYDEDDEDDEVDNS